MRTLFELWVEDGPRTRIERVFGTLGFALLVARVTACRDQVHTELSFAGDIPCIEFDPSGCPLPVEPLFLPLLASHSRPGGLGCRGASA